MPSCCGAKRAALRPPSARAVSTPRILIEYAGAGAVLEIGTVTGSHYHFAATGARVRVDARDASRVLARGDMRRR